MKVGLFLVKVKVKSFSDYPIEIKMSKIRIKHKKI